jgi:hypothetical protein
LEADLGGSQMERVWAVIVKIFTSETDYRGINERLLILVLVALLFALLISIIVARKNNLFHRPEKKNSRVTEAE